MLRTHLAKAAAVAFLALSAAAVTPVVAAHGTTDTQVTATTVWETAPVGKNTTVWETAPVGKNTTVWETAPVGKNTTVWE
ncbi:hypothetical protein OG389_17365 [Streptomyces sp. NBC_00435]|uniref:hypothetical protein n=1 Tax=Streptomyces sp. NBC_00435 TaxID=2903649 RepID=UPI002E215FA7